MAAEARLLESLLSARRALVDEPDEVRSSSFDEDDGTVVLELSVAEDDYGKVIGRGGRTANALRTVVKAAAVQRAVAACSSTSSTDAPERAATPAGSVAPTGSTARST